MDIVFARSLFLRWIKPNVEGLEKYRENWWSEMEIKRKHASFFDHIFSDKTTTGFAITWKKYSLAMEHSRVSHRGKFRFSIKPIRFHNHSPS